MWLGGEGDDQLWGSGRGAIGGVDVVPLQCALVGGEGDDQVRRSGRGAIAGCRCSVLWWGGVTTNFVTQKLVFAIWGLCWFNFSFNKENNIFEDGETSWEMSKIRSQMFTTVSLMIAYVQLDV